MKALVLGAGLQGKAVIHDLEQSSLISEIIAADMDLEQVERYLKEKGYSKTRALKLNASHEKELNQLVRNTRAHVVICMLPPIFEYSVARAALNAEIPFVSSSYTGRVVELDKEAREKDIILLPEMGMGPGIDLVLGRLAVNELDEVHGLYSYSAGLPEPACAADNPLKYKITWTFDGVLKAYKRPAKLLKEGKELIISGEDIFQPENIHEIEFPGVGRLEAYPNGNALNYINIFELGKGLKNMGRFAMRWTGHSQFWSIMVKLGFLDDTPHNINRVNISPRQFLVRHLTPHLQFRENERDIVLLRIEAWGFKEGIKHRVIYDLIDYRDLQTGFFAMNRTVGFTASIGAQMILSGKIKEPGVLSPAKHVPPWDLLEELKERGMHFDHRVEENRK
jgi:saccharopine dehydrogenase-like NADP-dependent oxidoreductase